MNDNGTMTITGCTISNNQQFPGEGGGGVLNDNGTMTITGSTISNNSASGRCPCLNLYFRRRRDIERLGRLINYH